MISLVLPFVTPILRVLLDFYRRKRWQSLQLQAERMRAVKAQRTASVQETVGSSIETPAEESLSGPREPNESVLLPAPDADDDS